jgi:outer membrane receptor protein involved in Fe transport
MRQGIASLGLAFALAGAAIASDVLDVPVAFSVPPQSLGEALRQLAKQADLQVLFAPALVDGRTSPAVSGTLSAREALQRMLSGTSLAAEEQSPGVVVVRERLRESRRSEAPVAREQAPPSAPEQTSGEDLQEVVVTAQRRKERLQDVPLSVTAYSQTTMDAQGTRSIDDLSRLTPGVLFTRSANNNNSESGEISIRGIVSNAGAATTGVYIDDTPIHGRHLSFPSYNTYPALFDIERVEVLRGPQGTLFGAGSEGGTVRFISPEPGLDRYALYARSEIAGTSKGDPLYEAGIAGGGPLIEDRLGFRASVSYRHEGGYVDRVDWHTGEVADKNANSNSTVTARVAMKWAAGDAVAVTPSLLYQKRDVDDTAAFWAPRPGEPDPTNGQFNSPFRTGNSVASPTTDKFLLPALKIEWNLGAVQLVSSTSYFKREQNATTDYTQFDRGIFLGNPYSLPGESGSGFWADDQKNWTQELRLESADADARVTWTTGIFYQHATETTSHRVYDPPLLTTLGLPADFGGGFIYVEDPRVGTDRQLALFGQANVKLTERLRMTLGARYAEARFKGSAHYPETLVVGPKVTSSGSEKEHPFTPKFGLEYQIDPDKLLYATAAKGFRIGGVNAKVGQFCYGPGGSLDLIGLDEVPASYSSDTLWSYELGTKNSLAGNRLLLNASAYLVKWKNIQQNVALGCGFQFTSNLGEADSKGFDIQAVIRPSDAFSLGATVGYTDAQFTKTVQLQPTVQSIVRDGDHLGASPWTAAVFAQLNFPAFGTQGYVRADYQYGAKQTDRVPLSNPENGGYSLWFEDVPETNFASLRTGLTWGGLDVSLFSQNLFDTRPRLTATQDIATPDGGTPLFYVISYRPRTIGLTATYHY